MTSTRLPAPFGPTIFVSAALLFLIQLIAGKALLPLFGGTPSVWTTCQLFFQTLLLGGYAYAHGISRLEPRRQLRIHAILLGVGSLSLIAVALHGGAPLLPPKALVSGDVSAPWGDLLLLLTLSTAAPFVALSATSPLLQNWHTRSGRPATYRLYALSNAGSILGLVGYPFLVEPWFTLETQAYAWAVLFLCFATTCMICAVRFASLGPAVDAAAVEASEPASPTRPRDVALWIALPLTSSALLLAITNQLCQEVAAVPFLWVLPLTLYLLSYMVAFDKPGWYRRDWVMPALLVMTLAVLIAAFLGITLGIVAQVVVACLYLGLFCLAAHGEVYRLRPPPARLTGFYLCTALGGAFGSILVGFGAPLLLDGYWELNLAVALGLALLAFVWWTDPESPLHTGGRRYFVLTATLAFHLVLSIGLVFKEMRSVVPAWAQIAWGGAFVGLFIGGLLAWVLPRFCRHPIWARTLIVAVLFLSECFAILRIRQSHQNTLMAGRNFFGTLSVIQTVRSGEPPQRILMHGRINHGSQYLAGPLRTSPVTYYGRDSGLDLALRHHAARRVPELVRDGMRLGVLGLGAGTLAAAAEAGDTVRFYEINPMVVQVAKGPKALFSYIADSKGLVEVVLGDARLELQRELERNAPGQFDLLVMDAFSSDSVPVHLLTQEAFQLYAFHLRNADSVLAVNVSNRFLDLRDLVATQGAELGMDATCVIVGDAQPWRTPSVWMLLSRSTSFHERVRSESQAAVWKPTRAILWTDSFSNPAALLHSKGGFAADASNDK